MILTRKRVQKIGETHTAIHGLGRSPVSEGPGEPCSDAWTLSWKKRNQKQEGRVVSTLLSGQPGRSSQTPRPPTPFHPPLPLPPSPALRIFLLLGFYPSVMVPFKCYLDLGSEFTVPSSEHLESITCMLPFIVFHFIFYVSCKCSSPALDWEFLKGCLNPRIFTSAFPTALSLQCFKPGLSQALVPLLISNVILDKSLYL